MAKELSAIVKLQIKGGAANPSPPIAVRVIDDPSQIVVLTGKIVMVGGTTYMWSPSTGLNTTRSEERRVGKECRSRW